MTKGKNLSDKTITACHNGEDWLAVQSGYYLRKTYCAGPSQGYYFSTCIWVIAIQVLLQLTVSGGLLDYPFRLH